MREGSELGLGGGTKVGGQAGEKEIGRGEGADFLILGGNW